MKNPPQNFFYKKKLQTKIFKKKTAKCQEALKDCVSTRKTSLQPKGFSLAGVSKNSAGTKRQKTKEHEEEEGRRWKKGGVLRPPPIAGRPVHLLHSSFTVRNFLTGFCFLQLGNFIYYSALFFFSSFFNFFGLVLLLGTY
jgi:hypothetical protein